MPSIEEKMSVQAVRRMRDAHVGIAELERKASQAASLLKVLANENRLLILVGSSNIPKCQ